MYKNYYNVVSMVYSYYSKYCSVTSLEYFRCGLITNLVIFNNSIFTCNNNLLRNPKVLDLSPNRKQSSEIKKFDVLKCYHAVKNCFPAFCFRKT